MAVNEPILDRDFAINQLGGNEELLEKMFGKFLSQYAEDADKVNQYIAAKEYQEARRTIHGIKGVSGNLGLKALQQASREAEDLLRNFEETPNHELLAQYISNFETMLKSTLAELENYQPTQNKAVDENEANEPNDGLSVDQAKATLVAAVDNFQFIAPPELQKLLAALQSTSIDLEQLEKAICDLDYDLAKTLLNT
jgi:HPt (histidine-containing phosphotransfer) domain-containing protein